MAAKPVQHTIKKSCGVIVLSLEKTATTAARIVIVFGSGLIGSSIVAALQRNDHLLHKQHLSWSWPQPTDSETKAVETECRTFLKTRPSSEIAVIWAAGRNGFGASEDDMDVEYRSFSSVRTLARRLALGRGDQACRFFHISSAGGLFEGQIACGKTARPRPLRPYGHGKLRQETALAKDLGLGTRLIIRPSSVYGFVESGRRGLVSALISAALQRRDAKIFGALTTQRDFLFAPDVGQYVARRVCATSPHSSETERVILASARPASVFEIVRTVEDCTGNPLYLKIDPRPDNARDNTFHASAAPPDFFPTPLREGIELTKSSIKRFTH